MKKLVIANRGEIARRIFRAAKQRNYSVAVISTEEDSDSLVCKEADCILFVSSFLNATEIVNAAKKWGADLLHPGYGFLSENSKFAEQVELAGIAFVGPTPQNMYAMGSKESAKNMAKKCGVPTLNALLSEDLSKLSPSEWQNELKHRNIFSPFLVKASGGGGGRGMRIVDDVLELPNAIKRASEEAKAAFNDGTVFIERYLTAPRHIEIQVFGDGKGGGVFFGERECSLQRRHQKVMEEAPSTHVNKELREKMGRASLSLVKETKYRGAGTLEFLLDENSNFYFLEMNTRLQVEHPVTENAYQIDLVHAQFDLAEGVWPEQFPNPNEFHLLDPKQVSIEARILAEDPRNQFLPTPGRIKLYIEPESSGVRVDSGIIEGARINSNYDSMISKLIVTAPNRALAIEKMSAALENYVILGCTTNLPFLQNIVRHPDFLVGNESTHWIAKELDLLNQKIIPNCLIELVTSKKFRELLVNILNGEIKQSKINNAFSNQAKCLPNLKGLSAEKEFSDFKIIREPENNKFYLLGNSIDSLLSSIKEVKNSYSFNLKKLIFNSNYTKQNRIPFYAKRLNSEVIQINFFGEYLNIKCPFYELSIVNKNHTGSGEICAPMAGKVIEVLIKEGQLVEAGQVLFIVESMKMQLEVKASGNGKVTNVLVEQGKILSGTDIMAMIALD
ncbi:biotin carboxylase N-terminal domain-containing protein [Pigmentibacter sp. JX0631]|uniref:acetyl/propionyl/methylcrotonyl-CoA carboxylase subunit alpha n=1 Tax=Pigmentibacter sp. JX0631 TaxID=2976982 RepID=UPI0024699832|nr:biotin carboxylase N-terminal domain-containing protein [Pigmentibacter sp. JX0631]WGL59698.1 biotin carboxylase N-terminal domain-containing protein [Pigmentibacter sp. JX0631]